MTDGFHCDFELSLILFNELSGLFFNWNCALMHVVRVLGISDIVLGDGRVSGEEGVSGEVIRGIESLDL